MNWGGPDNSANARDLWNNPNAGPVGHSWISQSLMFLDQTVPYQQTAFGYGLQYVLMGTDALGKSTQVKNNPGVANTAFQFLRCPSDISRGLWTNQDPRFVPVAGQPVATTNYKACLGSNWQADVTLQPGTPLPPPHGRISGFTSGPTA